ncbi:sorting nexin-17 isoform X2 [Syngnathoides biaculeatus]|uniref:sorting nexin-17 isoform X2 n=1 Tax=Syngnathoides biaculeatus TaxID=300417 RepID=UPI002ADDC01C|nr:sorting nexin-17 isoform X2 [Syngnathoides biaculeatus]
MHFSIPETEVRSGENGSTYVAYNIHVNGVLHCRVRYSQLLGLHEQMKKEYGSNVVPSFPPKKIFTLTPTEVEQRRDHLEKYMQAVRQDPLLGASESFNSFLRKAQQETQQIPTEEVALDVCLSNGQKVTVNVLSSDQTEDVLDVVATKLDLPEDLVAYFSLFLVREGEEGGLTLVRKLQEFELPYVSITSLHSSDFHILLRKRAPGPPRGTPSSKCWASQMVLAAAPRTGELLRGLLAYFGCGCGTAELLGHGVRRRRHGQQSWPQPALCPDGGGRRARLDPRQQRPAQAAQVPAGERLQERIHPPGPDAEILRLREIRPVRHRLPRAGLPSDGRRRQQRAQFPRQAAQPSDEGGQLQGHADALLESHVLPSPDSERRRRPVPVGQVRRETGAGLRVPDEQRPPALGHHQQPAGHHDEHLPSVDGGRVDGEEVGRRHQEDVTETPQRHRHRAGARRPASCEIAPPAGLS